MNADFVDRVARLNERDPTFPSWVRQHVAACRITPLGWTEIAPIMGPPGASFAWIHRARHLQVFVTGAMELDAQRWLHLSVTHRAPDRLPSWDELMYTKDAILGRDTYAVQVLAARRAHVNIHPNVLNIFACVDGWPLPDFTRGTEAL